MGLHLVLFTLSGISVNTADARSHLAGFALDCILTALESEST